MKKYFVSVVVLGALLLLVWGCSKDESPTDATDEVDFTLISTETIGPGGGEVEGGGLKLTVPPGAFEGSTDISIYISSDNQVYDEDAVSATYKIAGVPEDFAESIRLRIKYDSALSDESYIILGTDNFIKSLGETSTSYDLYPATDSSGYLLCDISVPESPPPTAAPNPSGASKNTTSVWTWLAAAVAKKQTHITPAGHFAITYPVSSVTVNSVVNLGVFLERAYNHYEIMGFSYSARTKWPIKVTVKDLGATVVGSYISTIWGLNYGFMEFNSRDISDTTEIKTTAGHEFFHLVQTLYDPRGPISIARGTDYKHYWLDEACAVWSEEYFSSNPNYRSPTFPSNEGAPFVGLQIDRVDSAQWHGYGMSPLIRDLYNNSSDGDQLIIDIYEQIKAKRHPVEAILIVAGEPTFWWSLFFESYMTGTHYNVFGDIFVNRVEDTFVIDEQYTLKSITESYQDISATMYLIELPRADYGTSDILKMKATGTNAHPEILVFKYKPANWQLLAEQKDSLFIGDLAAMTLDDWGVAAIVVHNGYTAPTYRGSTDIEFEVDLVEPPELDQENFGFSYTIHAFWDTNYGSSWEKEDQSSQYCCGDTGRFNGYVFSTSWDKPIYEGSSKGTFTATVDVDVTKIISYTVKDTTTKHYSGYPDNIYVTEVSGANVPLNSTYEGNLYFRSQGTVACNAISTFKHFIAAAGDTARIVNHQCNIDSKLYITFTKNR